MSTSCNRIGRDWNSRRADLLRLAALLLPLLLPSVLAAQIDEVWVARYDGPASGYDEARAVVADDWGNVYVTAKSQGGAADSTASTGTSPTGTGYDYVTIKYDSSGNQLWLDRYCGPGYADALDEPWDIAIDAEGNIYVTGSSTGVGTDWDYATIKYDPDGNRLWVARYDGIGRDRDKGYAVDVDQWGNVYVTGSSRGLGPYADYATVKYSASGEQQWVARYVGPSDTADRPEDIVVHTDGSVYVTGTGDALGGDYDCTTVKYTADGVEEWVATYSATPTGWDMGYDIALDAAGNVYVAGWSDGPGTGPDYLTIKYDSEGAEQWVARYDGPAYGATDYAHDMTVDASGNVYVTGHAGWGITGHDFATIKYDTDGNQEWLARYGGSGFSSLGDLAYSIALDGLGNVYVTGMNDNNEDYDCATVKYSPAGVEQWAAVYEGPEDSDGRGVSIAVTAWGDAYVAGRCNGFGASQDVVTLKYSDGTGVLPSHGSTSTLSLSSAMPNPFARDVRFAVDVSQYTEQASVCVYSAQGRLIRRIHCGPLAPGRRVFNWDGASDTGTSVASGLYFVRATAGELVSVEKVVRVR